MISPALVLGPQIQSPLLMQLLGMSATAPQTPPASPLVDAIRGPHGRIERDFPPELPPPMRGDRSRTFD